MYKEFGTFLYHIARQPAIWRDGELWTAVAIGISTGAWITFDSGVADALRDHCSDILTLSSIVFGFVMSTLLFYVGVASTWAKDPRVQAVAHKIIDWHVWSIVCLLFQIFYAIMLCALDGRVYLGWGTRPIWYAILVFLISYCALQLLNHAMLIWWAFRNSNKLMSPKDEEKTPAANDCGTSDASDQHEEERK